MMNEAQVLEGNADILIRAGVIHTQQPDGKPQRAIATQGGKIIGLSQSLSGLDKLIGSRTQVIDVPDGTVLPSMDDTHTHLVFAARSAFDVHVEDAKSVEEILSLLSDRAKTTPPGEWIISTTNWQEFNLREQRFPTLQELDQVSTQHPIALKRGGHSQVANSAALAKAGITADTASPDGGLIGRHPDGRLNGLLQDHASFLLNAVIPAMRREQCIDGLDVASKAYAATGTGCVRDCMVTLSDFANLRACRAQGRLHVRVRALISAVSLSSAAQVEELLDAMEALRPAPGQAEDDWLRVWGVKFMLDGGIEAGATEEPYAVDPETNAVPAPPAPASAGGGGDACCGGDGSSSAYAGTLTWEADALLAAMDAVVRRGLRVGTHAYGDRAIRQLLDVYERLLARHHRRPAGGLPHATLVMEHGALATPELRARAIRLGIPTTIQHPLMHDVAGVQGKYWGDERVARMYPARGWLDEGGEIAGGSDFPVGSFAAMRSIWGMASRETVVGVRGPEHAVSVAEALDLHTVRAANLLNEGDSRGQLEVGRVADLTIWPVDPLTVENVQELRDLTPLVTIVGGEVQHSKL